MPLDINDLLSNLLGPLHSDSFANLVWWSEGELTRFFDETVKRLGYRAGVFAARNTNGVTLVAGTATYALPARTIDVLHVSLSGAPLIASSTSELEMLDDTFQSTEGTPSYWYADRSGLKIGFYPVPNTAAGGLSPELIIHQLPEELDEAHVVDEVPVPAPVGDYLEMAVLMRAYAKESDAALPEVAANLQQMIALVEQAMRGLYGEAQ